MRRLIRSKEPGPTVSAGGKSSAPAGAETPQRLRCLPAKRASAASAAVMPQGAGFSGDRGGLIKRGPRSETLWGVRPLSTGGKWTERPPGGPLHQGRNAPRNPRSPVLRKSSPALQPRVCRGASLFLRGSSVPRPSSKKKRVYGRNMVPFPDANCAGGPVSLDRLGRRKNRLPAALRRSRGAGQIARGPRRRVPASDFRQFICRKSMEFSGPPQKRSFCGARCRNGVSAETPAIKRGGGERM